MGEARLKAMKATAAADDEANAKLAAARANAGLEVYPTEDWVLIRRATTTVNGLHLPSGHAGGTRVVRVGPGRIDANGNTIPVRLKEGDRVLINAQFGTQLQVPPGHDDLALVREAWICGTLVEKTIIDEPLISH